jgi:phosphoglycolate phosphatase
VLIERARGLEPARRRGLVSGAARGFRPATLDAPLVPGTVFDGIRALLWQLQPAWPLVVVSNKPSTLARAVLDAGGLLSHLWPGMRCFG